jgi:hypothetical protein
VGTLVGLLVANQASIDEVQLCVSKLLQQTLDSLPESSEQQKHMSMVYITGLVKGGMIAACHSDFPLNLTWEIQASMRMAQMRRSWLPFTQFWIPLCNSLSS